MCKIQYGDSVTTNEEAGDILIKYNDILIGKLEEGNLEISTATLPCSGKYMIGDLTIGSGTLPCKGKTMDSDVVIIVDDYDSEEEETNQNT